METYVIVRRGVWRTPEDLRAATERSGATGERMRDEVDWIRSYVLSETNGSFGTICIYQSSSPEAIRRHAATAELPVDEIVAVADTLVVRSDPLEVST